MTTKKEPAAPFVLSTEAAVAIDMFRELLNAHTILMNNIILSGMPINRHMEEEIAPIGEAPQQDHAENISPEHVEFVCSLTGQPPDVMRMDMGSKWYNPARGTEDVPSVGTRKWIDIPSVDRTAARDYLFQRVIWNNMIACKNRPDDSTYEDIRLNLAKLNEMYNIDIFIRILPGAKSETVLAIIDRVASDMWLYIIPDKLYDTIRMQRENKKDS